MGIFSKITDNFKHGVKVSLESPASVSKNNKTMPIKVTIENNGKKDRKIKSVTVELEYFKRDGVGSESKNQIRTLSKRSISNEFELPIGEKKEIKYEMDYYKIIDGFSPMFSGKTEKALEIFSSTKRDYFVRAFADVEGIALDPSAKNDIDIR